MEESRKQTPEEAGGLKTEKRQEALDQLCKAYSGYYTINRETPAAPFAAEAEFRMHDEQYFLIKAAKYTEYDSNEFVYVALPEHLDPQSFAELDARAWELGTKKVEPKKNHRNSDVTLIILTDAMDPETETLVRKAKHYQSYGFLGLRGWSHYRVIVYDLSEGKLIHNRMGENLKEILSKTYHL